MFQVRIHGRGGQGVVTAAELMSIAAFLQGKYSQAFPTFGSERMGAPVTAFCRISEKSIRSRDPVVQPDALIIQDPTLLHHVPVFEGLPSSAYVLINSARTFRELSLEDIVEKITPARCVTVPATQLALEHVGRPLPNSALLGVRRCDRPAADQVRRERNKRAIFGPNRRRECGGRTCRI